MMLRRSLSGAEIAVLLFALALAGGCGGGSNTPGGGGGVGAGTGGSGTGGASAGVSGGAGAAGNGSAGTTGTGGGTAGSGGSTAGSGSAGRGGGGGSTGGSGASGGSTGGDSGGSTAGSGGTASGGSMAGRGGTIGTAGSGGSAGGPGGRGGGGGANGGSAGGASCVPPPTPTPSGMDWVNGTLVTINDNGAWTWYSDERAIVDTAKGKLVVTSDANGMGPGGSGRDGNVDAVVWDLATRTGSRTVLGDLSPDDHNNAGLLVRPDGNYLAMYAGHNQDCRTYWRNYVNNAWTAQQSFDWVPLGCDLSVNTKVTYSNPWNMTAESRIYSFVRSIGTSPNLLVSTDQGMTWSYGGRLTSTPQVGYVAGYYKYWGNGVDRIDFLATEAHPRDFDNSLYHGYIQGGRTYNSAGQMIDANLSDDMQPQITAFTKVFATGTTINGVRLHHAWNSDIMRYPDGTIAIIWKARVGSDTNNPDHRLMYGRFDGTSWKLTYLVKAGPKLYESEQDYIGLGSLHPDDPRTIYISTTIDPRNDTTNLMRHEIFQGTTCDNGTTWQWTPITANSTRLNLRPIVPKWDSSHTALLWFRGTYETAQRYNMAVVGLVSPL